MKYLETYKAMAQDNEEALYWINHNLRNYLKTNPENNAEIEHIIDFLKSDAAPTRLRKMSYEEANQGAKRWVKTLIKKGVDFELVEHVDYDVIIDFKDGFQLWKLKSKEAFKNEGSLMAHCVASYFGGDSNIYSLRDSRGMPHATLEIPNGAEEFNQCKGKGNGSIHPKYVEYIFKTAKHFKMPIRDTEMTHLGYSNLEEIAPGFTDFVLQNTKGAKFLDINGKRFFYNNSSLKKRG